MQFYSNSDTQIGIELKKWLMVIFTVYNVHSIKYSTAYELINKQ